jgi:hypothetical protein
VDGIGRERIRHAQGKGKEPTNNEMTNYMLLCSHYWNVINSPMIFREE